MTTVLIISSLVVLPFGFDSNQQYEFNGSFWRGSEEIFRVFDLTVSQLTV
jgi:hypothetical protein